MTNANAKVEALLMHDYCEPENMETDSKGIKNILTSPSKQPVPQKKQKGDKDTTAGAHAGDASNATILWYSPKDDDGLQNGTKTKHVNHNQHPISGRV